MGQKIRRWLDKAAHRTPASTPVKYVKLEMFLYEYKQLVLMKNKWLRDEKNLNHFIDLAENRIETVA